MESHHCISLLAFAGHHARTDLQGTRSSLCVGPSAILPAERLFPRRSGGLTLMALVSSGLRLVAVGLVLLLARDVAAQAALPVYTDYLVNGFQDWGWATRDYAN